MDSLWNPYQVLELDGISTCVGYAHSQGRRCGNQISFAKTESAEILLDSMSGYPVPSGITTHEYLEELAHYLLCPQRHEDQAESLIETWKRRILRFKRAQVEQEIQNLQDTVDDITAKLEASSLTAPHPPFLRGSPRTRVTGENRPVQSQGYNAVHYSATSSSSAQRSSTVHNDNSRPSITQINTTNADRVPNRPRYNMQSSIPSVYPPLISPPSATVRQAEQSGVHSVDNHPIRHPYNIYSGVSAATMPFIFPATVQQFSPHSPLIRSQPSMYSRIPSANKPSASPSSTAVRPAKNGSRQSQHLGEAKKDCPICFDGFESMHDLHRCAGCLQEFHQNCNDTWFKQCERTGVNATCPCW